MYNIAVAPFVGAWIEIGDKVDRYDYSEIVAPFVGAWIEIKNNVVPCPGRKSLPSWERGLKFAIVIDSLNVYSVAPFVGAWIEIIFTISMLFSSLVAPFVGAWIEIPPYPSIPFPSSVAPFVGAWIEMQSVLI